MDTGKLLLDESAARLVCGALQLQSFYPDFNPERAVLLFPRSGLYSFSRGSVVVAQGDPGRDLYIIQTGMVRVTRAGAAGPEHLADLGPGELFGEVGLLKDGRRVATVTAQDDCTIFRVVHADLQHLLANHHTVGDHLRRLLAQRLEAPQRRAREALDPDLKLGEIMVRDGALSPEHLRHALQVQASTGGMLGEILVRLGYASEEAITMAIGVRLGVPCAAENGRIPKPKWNSRVSLRITETFCRDNSILPIFIDGQILSVAMVSPEDMIVRENIRLLTGYEIEPMIATRAQIFRAIDDFFSGAGSNPSGSSGTSQAAAVVQSLLEEVDLTEERIDLDRVLARQHRSGAVSYVNTVLKHAISERASDIHFEAYLQRVELRFRIDGDLFERLAPPWELYPAIVSRLKILSRLDIAEKRLPQDGSMAVRLQDRNIDFRVSVCPTVFGENVVLRILDKGTAALDVRGLGLEADQQANFLAAAARPHGLIFLTGPTGSGKTTTLYALLNHIRSPKIKILTAEDPVEYKIDGINQVPIRTAIGLTFAAALRCFLRQDPDVILVGEVRDQETADICVRAALTGHLVISTLHTNSALESVPRLVDMGVDPFLVASSVCLVAAQRLVRILCPSCKRPYRPEADEAVRILKGAQMSPSPDPSTVTFFKEIGCARCAFTGFIGRTAIYEIVPITPELAKFMYKSSSDLLPLQAEARRQGIMSLRTAGWRKALQGVTTVDEVFLATVEE